MIENLASVLGGLGIFFFGLHILNSGLRPMTNRRSRMLLAHWTQNPLYGGFIGLFCGAVTQSMATLSFIIAGLVSVGLIAVRQALPIICWANPGPTILVFLSTINIKIFVLLLFGIAGGLIAFARAARQRYLAYILFGLGFLFYGLSLIKTGASSLSQTDWVRSVLLSGKESYLLAFLVGGLLTAIVQSSSAVAILAITMAQTGIFTPEQTIMVIYGTGIGSSAITWLLSYHIKGTPKQLIMAQVLFNVVGVAPLVALFFIELWIDIPMVTYCLLHISDNLEQQMTLAYALYNLNGAVLLSFAFKPYARMLSIFWPPTKEEEWSQVVFLRDQVAKDPEIAVAMLAGEQNRQVRQLSLFVEELRRLGVDEREPAFDAIHSAFCNVSREISAFASDLLARDLSHETSEQIITLCNRQKFLDNLEELLHELTRALANWSQSEFGSTLFSSFLESIDVLMVTASEALETGDRDEINVLIELTQDRSEVMSRMRRVYLNKERDLSADDRMNLLNITGLWERTVWSLSRIALSIRQNPDADSSQVGPLAEPGLG